MQCLGWVCDARACAVSRWRRLEVGCVCADRRMVYIERHTICWRMLRTWTGGGGWSIWSLLVMRAFCPGLAGWLASWGQGQSVLRGLGLLTSHSWYGGTPAPATTTFLMMQMNEEDPRSLVRQQKNPHLHPSVTHPSIPLHTGVPPGDVPQSIRGLGVYLPVAVVATPTLHLPLTRHGKGGAADRVAVPA